MPALPNMSDMTLPELEGFLADLGEPAFRARQVFQWLWAKGDFDPHHWTNLAKGLRERLARDARVEMPAVHEAQESRDGTVKLLLRLADSALVETVLIPEEDYWTQCLSSQVGCAMGCSFCATGGLGFERNMTSGEMLGQILVARARLEAVGDSRPLRNLVFMGMGEPMLNTAELLRALQVISHPLGLDFSVRRVTVSTVGLCKGIEALGATGLASLAVSLHAPTQALRERIMPSAARATPLDELMACLDRYPLKPRQRITYEYLLLAGVNDSEREARELVRLLGQRKAKVNLIVFNPSPELPYEPPSPERVLAFERQLWDRGLIATLRKSKGQDIAAACGQLRAACQQ